MVRPEFPVRELRNDHLTVNAMANTCKPLGTKLAQFFKPVRPYHSPPPNLAGRKRVYCCDCESKWIMVEPERIEFHTTTHPFRCMQCAKIRHRKLKTDGVRVPCSGNCGRHQLVFPAEVESVTGWKCFDCQYKKKSEETK